MLIFLVIQVDQLQQALHEVQVSKAECEAQLDQLSLQNKLCGEEMKQLEGTLEALRQEAQGSARELKEKESSLQALRQQLTDTTQQHEHQMVSSECVCLCLGGEGSKSLFTNF